MCVSLSTMRNKTDRNDAHGIAQMMCLVPRRSRQDHRHAEDAHAAGQSEAAEAQADRHRKPHSWRTAGLWLLVGAIARGAYEARIRELLERSDPIFAMTIEAMLDVRRAIFEGYERLHRVLLQVVQHDPVCRRLMTVPGVGTVAALPFKVDVDDPRRFARSRTVGAHFGPRRHQSGTSIDNEGRISKQGDVAVREALFEAAARLLLRVRKWSALRPWGLRIAKRSNMLCAIVAVARKLAGILHRMWVSETDFHVGFGAKVTQRLRLRHAP